MLTTSIRISPLAHAIVLSIACLLAGTARSADTPSGAARDIDTIVVTGTKVGDAFGEKSGIPLERMPQSVQVLTSDDILERGVNSVGDLMRTVPSANIGNSRVSRYQSFSLKIRGFLADQMRNGMRQRYYEDVDASALSNIERVEVLKGPSGVLYGQSAIGGIVSIVTKMPEETFKGSASLTVGSFDQRAASFDVGGPAGDRFGIRVTGEIERSGTFVDAQDIDRENIAVSMRWRPDDRIDARFVAEYVKRKTLSNPGLPVVGTVVSNGIGPIAADTFLAEPAFADLEADSPLLQSWVDIALGGSWTLTPRLQYSELDTPFTQIRVRGVDPADPRLAIRNGRIGSEKDRYTIAQLDLTGRFATGSLEHTLLVGYEYDRERSTFVQSNFVSVPSIDVLRPTYLTRDQRPPAIFAFKLSQRLDSHAFYAQDQIAIGERADLILGLRRTRMENDGYFSTDPNTFGAPDTENADLTTFQVGGSYQLDRGFSFYGGYNSGFDVENSFGGAPTVSGERLRPETSEQYEAGVRYASGNARMSASAFDIRRRDVAGDDPDNPGFSRNIGAFRVRGVEFEGEFDLQQGLTLSGGYAYLDSEIADSANAAEIGGRIADVAKHSANLRLRYAIPGTPIDLRAGVVYQGARPVAGASAILLDEVLLADAGIGADFGRYRIDMVANNLFDERYFTVDGVHQGSSRAVQAGEPRSISARFTVSF